MTRVALIGPGRVGTALAIALPPRDYEVVAVAGRGAASLARFAEVAPAVRALPLADAARAGDLVLICVPDDALAETVRDAVRVDAVREGSRWVHTCGAHGSAVLRPAQLAGAAVAACHPAQTFPDPQSGARALPGTSWAVTAAERDLDWAQRFVTDLRGRPVVVGETARTLYHAALTIGANGASSVVTLARELLLGAGVEDPASFLEPLVTASAANAAARGAAALTGPARRGEAGTIARHVAELRETFPEALDAYAALGRLAVVQARRAGLDADRADRVAKLLEEAEH